MRRLLIRLYPAAWRKRYGDELEELMGDVPAGWRTAFDVFKGAMKMRLTWGSPSGLVLGLMVVGGIAGGAASYLIPQTWESKGLVEIHGRGGRQATVESIMQSTSNVTSRQSLAHLMTDASLNLYSDQRRTTPLEDIEDTMRSSIRIGILPEIPADGGYVFTVSFVYTDPAKTRDTTNAFIARMNQELKDRHPEYEITTLDAPALPTMPFAPERSLVAISGSFVGLILATATLLVRRPTQPRGPGLKLKTGLVLGCMAAGVIAGTLVSYLYTPVWRAAGVGEIHGPGGSQAMTDSFQQSRQIVTSRQSLANVMTDASLDLYRDERRTQPLENIEDTMHHNTRVELFPEIQADGGEVFGVSFTYPDPVKARDTTSALLNAMSQALNARGSGYTIQVLDTPALPRKRFFPKREGFMVIGLVAGLVLSLATLLFRRRTNPPTPGLQLA